MLLSYVHPEYAAHKHPALSDIRYTNIPALEAVKVLPFPPSKLAQLSRRSVGRVGEGVWLG